MAEEQTRAYGLVCDIAAEPAGALGAHRYLKRWSLAWGLAGVTFLERELTPEEYRAELARAG